MCLTAEAYGSSLIHNIAPSSKIPALSPAWPYGTCLCRVSAGAVPYILKALSSPRKNLPSQSQHHYRKQAFLTSLPSSVTFPFCPWRFSCLALSTRIITCSPLYDQQARVPRVLGLRFLLSLPEGLAWWLRCLGNAEQLRNWGNVIAASSPKSRYPIAKYITAPGETRNCYHFMRATLLMALTETSQLHV